MLFLDTYSYNVSIAKVFGVSSSVFLTALNDEYNFQKSHKLLNANSTLSVSRQEIYDRTGLDDDKQKEIEIALSSCGVITVKPLQNVANKNYYIINLEQLEKIMNAPSPEEAINNSNATQFIKKPRVEPMSKRKTYIKDLKKKISVEDPVIQQYFCDWIDSVYTNPKGFLSPSAVSIAQNELLTYANNNQEKQIAILKIAIKNGYRDLSWAMNVYEHTNSKDGIPNNFVSYNDIKSDGTGVADEEF